MLPNLFNKVVVCGVGAFLKIFANLLSLIIIIRFFRRIFFSETY